MLCRAAEAEGAGAQLRDGVVELAHDGGDAARDRVVAAVRRHAVQVEPGADAVALVEERAALAFEPGSDTSPAIEA
jgi:hypothetical protein